MTQSPGISCRGNADARHCEEPTGRAHARATRWLVMTVLLFETRIREKRLAR
jgi:hypothetical protein